jgi:hypothetical protein
MRSFTGNDSTKKQPPVKPQKFAGAAKPALHYALRYAKEGIRVFPMSRLRVPMFEGWPDKATCDAATIKQWAAEYPGCNWGLEMGNGFVAIDVDDTQVIRNRKIPELTPTRAHATPGHGGMHCIYTVPEGVVIKNSVGKVCRGVDIKSDRGFIVCPGSTHPKGGVYTIIDERTYSPLSAEWIAKLSKAIRAPRTKRRVGDGTIPEGQRESRHIRVAGAMRRVGASEATIRAALGAQNKECEQPHNRVITDKDLDRIARSGAKYEPDEHIQELLNDERPKVLLPGEDRLVSDVASELAGYLHGSLYVHNREVVMPEKGKLHVIEPQDFRTLVEKTVVCCRKSKKQLGVEIGMTMTNDEACAILASRHLLEALRPVERVNTVRLPVRRGAKKVELLPEGYDEATRTLTISTVTYQEDMKPEAALKVFRDLYAEFEFADDGRSLSVTITAMLGLYGDQLVPRDALRPAFTVIKSAEGAGGTLLVASVLIPVLGYMPTTGKPTKEEEMEKIITSLVLEGATVLPLDNVKGRLDSPSLERLVTSRTISGRILCTNKMITADHNIVVFVTSNFATVTPDWRRRSLFIELHLTAERAEDRVFKHDLSEAVLKAKRPQILAACYAVVRNWVEQRMPPASRSHSSFPEWAKTFGGMVEAIGYRCPLEPSEVGHEADEDGAAMRSLTEAMEPGKEYDFKGITSLARDEDVFLGLVGNPIMMDSAQRSAFGYVLKRYHKRRVGDCTFFIDGKGHARRYRIELLKPGSRPVQTVQGEGRVLTFTQDGHQYRMNIGDSKKAKRKSVWK